MAAAPVSQIAVLVAIVDRPGLALSNVLGYPRWRWVLPCGLAIVLLAAIALVSAPLLAELSSQEAQVMVGQLSQLTAEQSAQVQEQLAALQTPAAQAAISFASGLAGYLATWLTRGLIVYMIALIAGADVSLIPLFAVIPWLSVPSMFEWGMSIAYVASTGRLVVNRGLSYLVSSGDPLADAGNLGYAALGQISIFHIWHLCLVYALFGTTLRLGRGPAIWLTALFAAILLGIALGFATLSRLMVTGL